MVNRRRAVSVAVVLGVVLGGSATVKAQDRRISVVVHVDDRVGLPCQDLATAKGVVERILGNVGVSVTWADGALSPAVTAAPSNPRQLALVISKERTACAQAACEQFDEVLGRAFHFLGRAEVFADQIDAALARRSFDHKIVLGLVMAHEIGHLLLPPGSHSRSGIMRASLDFRLQGGFTREQAEQIRGRLVSGTWTALEEERK